MDMYDILALKANNKSKKNESDIADLANKTAVTANHQFVDVTVRDTYFTANPTELVDKIFILVGTQYQQRLNNAWMNVTTVLSQLLGKLTTSTFTAITNDTTNIVHNLSTYDSAKDDLLVFYNGILLTKTINYTENANKISIDLVGWNIDIGESIYFRLYKNVK